MSRRRCWRSARCWRRCSGGCRNRAGPEEIQQQQSSAILPSRESRYHGPRADGGQSRGRKRGMPAIFISHSSLDQKAADDIKAVLAGLGFDRVFLDFDKVTGIGAGENWEKRLHEEIA